jgi:hypothetical protein
MKVYVYAGKTTARKLFFKTYQLFAYGEITIKKLPKNRDRFDSINLIFNYYNNINFVLILL